MTAQELKEGYGRYLKEIKAQIPELLEKEPLQRKALIDKLVALSPLSAEEKRDVSAGSALTQYKSIAGAAIKKLEAYGDLEISEGGTVTLKKKPEAIIREAEISRYIIECVKAQTLTAKQITEAALSYFGAERTPELADDVTVEVMVRRLLTDLVRRGKLAFSYGKYTISSDSIVIKKPRSLYEEFITLLNSRGGEFFENYSAILLDKYYTSLGMSVGYCNVIGGSDDGGIDVILTVSDQLGFKDKILVQCKQKSGSFVTLKELKEFIGAFYVDRGTRGIFMTTSRFHKEASLLFADVSNIIPIDGPKLFDIAKSCECGLKKEGVGFTVDREFFDC